MYNQTGLAYVLEGAMVAQPSACVLQTPSLLKFGLVSYSSQSPVA